MSSFIILPSNSSFDTYPDNTPSCYKVHLTRPVELGKGDWEVGLAEIQYTHSWYTLQSDVLFYVHFSYTGTENDVDDFQDALMLDRGYYTSIKHVCSTMSSKILKKYKLKEINLEYNRKTEKVVINVGDVVLNVENQERPFSVSLRLPKVLCDMFGFRTAKDGSWCTFQRTVKSEYTADIYQGNYSIYVYCNLVQPHLVGDQAHSLLRIIPVNIENQGKVVTNTYQKVQYYPLSFDRFDTVEINIKDDTNNFISFERGKSIVTLHLREKK